MDSFKNFFEDKCGFYSSLKDTYVSEKDYSRAANVWNTFKMKSLGDYHEITR